MKKAITQTFEGINIFLYTVIPLIMFYCTLIFSVFSSNWIYIKKHLSLPSYIMLIKTGVSVQGVIS